MEITRLSEFKVDENSLIKVTMCGNIIELMYSERKSNGNTIRKLDDYHYVDIATGEVKEYNKTINRAQSPNELRKTFKKIRDVINCNTDKPYKCRWVTLTYKQRDSEEDAPEPMTDPKKLYRDVEAYIKRLRRRVGHFEYIQVAEPQRSGAWHVHMVMIFPKRAPFIDNRDMEIIWGNGWTDTQPMDKRDNLGAYLSAYLGDIFIDEVKDIKTALNIQGLEIKEVEFNGEKKSVIKGGRLHMYPAKFNILRCSRGIKRPEVIYMSEEMAQKKVSSAKLTFEKTIRLSDKDNDFENTINYRYYNSIRK